MVSDLWHLSANGRKDTSRGLRSGSPSLGGSQFTMCTCKRIGATASGSLKAIKLYGE